MVYDDTVYELSDFESVNDLYEADFESVNDLYESDFESEFSNIVFENSEF